MIFKKKRYKRTFSRSRAHYDKLTQEQMFADQMQLVSKAAREAGASMEEVAESMKRLFSNGILSRDEIRRRITNS